MNKTTALSSDTASASALPSIRTDPAPAERLQEKHPIAQAIDKYLASIRGIGLTAQIALPHIADWTIAEIEATQKTIERFVPSLPMQGERPKTITLESARDFAEFTNTIHRLEELRQHNYTAVLAKSIFTQLFAEFDSYIGDLLKVIYLRNDQLLKGVSREISLADLLDFEDLNAVKLSMLEKEVDTFRRDSYVEQFSTLERKFSIELKKFKEWPEFVELSQRRNIIIHNGGMVSNQYLLICDREGYKFVTKPDLGQPLDVDFEYFSNASRLLSKVGLMLALTLWSKVFPRERDQLHSTLNSVIYLSLEQKRWKFVAELEDFILGDSMRKEISEIDLRIRTVNTAIGLKFSGKDDESRRRLKSVDWSASYRDFKLAIAVLEERYDEAIRVMKSIGRSGEIIKQTDYHTWPLFTRFRERPEFYEAYFQIYGETFAEKIEAKKGAVETHVSAAQIRQGSDSVQSVMDVTACEVSERT